MKYGKNKNVLAGTFSKIPSSLSGKDVYDKKGNKMQALYRKNGTNVPGGELYDKKGNKIDKAYSKLNLDEDKDKKLIEIF